MTLLVVLFILYNSLLGSSITQIEVHPQTLTIMHAHNDSLALSAINAQFIQNFVTQNVKAHDQIIDPDFVCIDGSGRIVNRETYLKNWATDYDSSGCTSFTYGEQCIRIFGNIALVRSKTTAIRMVNGISRIDHTIYTDTYKKEKGKWRCIQVQITPIK